MTARVSVRHLTPVYHPFLLLLLMMPALVVSGCGCWGTHRIYVHYRPPVTGWFHLSPSYNYLYYERVYGAEPQKRQFLLKYMTVRNYWVLSEKQSNESVVLLNTRRQSRQLLVSCPTGRCACQKVKVSSPCWAINGVFHRLERNHVIDFSLNNTMNDSVVHTRPREARRRRSLCMLHYLGQCLRRRTLGLGMASYSRGGYHCRKHVHPFTNTSQPLKPYSEQYIYNNFKLKKIDEHDFWIVESNESVYAVSRNTGPCPDQLMPDSDSWVRTDDHFSEKINVTCITWDSLSSD